MWRVAPGMYRTGSELDLAKRYRTSLTPVREACQFLHKDGFLEPVPHKGFFVSEITMKQIRPARRRN